MLNEIIKCLFLLTFILTAIRWAQEAWKEVTGTTIKNCFEKYGIIKNDDLMEIEEEYLEFEALV